MRIATALTVIFLIAVAPGFAQNTLRVPGQFATIQAAIDAAQPRDTVLVAPGRYTPIDYKGKTIIVKSASGPFSTTIDGRGASGSVVTMNGTGATLEGFTVEGGRGRQQILSRVCPIPCYPSPRVTIVALFGAGIYAPATGVVIKNNIVRNNVLHGQNSYGIGAGIWVANGALVQSNFVTNNDAGSTAIPVFCVLCNYVVSFDPRGGGVYSPGAVFLADNVITGNAALAGAGVLAGGGAFTNNIIANNRGDGIVQESLSATTLQLTNNTLMNNGGFGYRRHFFSPGAATMTNCVVRGNSFGQIGSGSITVTYSNVQGGHTGTGNIDVTAGFIDGALGDFHLRYDSPCRDAGTTATPLPTGDFEGNPRVVGASVDMGADEFADRLYVTGNPRPGGLVHVKIIGAPGKAAYWAYSLTPRLANPPVMIPGLGALYLQLPIIVSSAGTISPAGIAIVPVSLPAALPAGTVLPLQALIGSQLSNPWVQTINVHGFALFKRMPTANDVGAFLSRATSKMGRKPNQWRAAPPGTTSTGRIKRTAA